MQCRSWLTSICQPSAEMPPKEKRRFLEMVVYICSGMHYNVIYKGSIKGRIRLLSMEFVNVSKSSVL